MALISQALTTLADAKLIAGVSGTSDDALLELLINSASVSISGYCSRDFGRADYTEYIPASGRQSLQVKNWPIASVSSVKDNDVTLTVNVDYRLDTQDKAQGQIYREQGWAGSWSVRGMTNDPNQPRRILTVAYTAGYYLPGAVGYVAGAADSLPLDISMVCNMMVAERYAATKQNSHGLKSLSEGDLSYTWGIDSAQYGNLSAGIADKYAVVLNRFRRAVFA